MNNCISTYMAILLNKMVIILCVCIYLVGNLLILCDYCLEYLLLLLLLNLFTFMNYK